jgi:hypothetical protein
VKYQMTKRTTTLPVGLIVLALLFCSLAAQTKQGEASDPSALPDLVGIRPGMPAQEAYTILKARNPNIKIGMGQAPIPGFGDKPVVTEMRAQVTDPSAPETITIWLTIPPTKQVVFAVGRLLEYDPNQPLLRSKIMESLREKYGTETDAGNWQAFWGFDEHGGRPDPVRLKQLNCMSRGHGNLMVSAPQDSTFAAPSMLVYSPEADNGCEWLIKLNAYFTGRGGVDSTYVYNINVLLWDARLQRQTQQAYQAYLAHADTAKSKEELEKAKQRKLPKF